MISWSNWTPNDSFGICLSWGFQNCPWSLNLMKFWLRYLRLKSIESTSKISFSSTFYWLFENGALSSTLNNSVNPSSILEINDSFGIFMTSRFQNCPWSLNLMKNLLSYSRLKAKLHFQRVNKSWREAYFWNALNCL